ncbi:MAG: hypothetical protein LKM40_07085 [Mageeibacillus sp.]|jgi:hypothetical protein|nr:hypothetical protein [Mageeibacillus sp.]
MFTPVDMFPHTSSIETVVLLSKLSSAKHHVTIDLGMDELDIYSVGVEGYLFGNQDICNGTYRP